MWRFKKWLRSLAWWIIKKTDESTQVEIEFFEIQSGKPVSLCPRMLAWREPAFESRNGRTILPAKNVGFRIFDRNMPQKIEPWVSYRVGNS